MRLLLVGDPHATPDALPEMERLVDLISQTVKTEKVNRILFMGDQYHTHSIVHLGVMAFWEKAFNRLVSEAFVWGLVGNHDKSGVKGIQDNALMLHGNLIAIDKPHASHGLLHIPYMADNEEFIAVCQEYSQFKTVLCHQSFTGAKFENGAYDPNGIDPDAIPQTLVISGHIHSPQKFGKVWYVGAPRWRIVTDANTERAIWVVEFDEEGKILNSKSIDTSTACTPMWILTDTEASPVKLPKGNAKTVVDIHGTPEFVDRRKVELEELGVRVRTFYINQALPAVRESDGIAPALRKFLAGWPTNPEILLQLAQERISWLKAA